MKKNIMIDLETMGSGSNAAIVAVGAVRFGKGGIGETFYKKISLAESCSYGMEIDADTVIWWLKQSDEARAELTDGNTSPLLEVMTDFEKYLNDDDVVWGNGSDFDNVILGNLWKSLDKEVPWKFWNSQCYRTMKNTNRDVKMQRQGTHHNALDDAISQAEHLIDIAISKNIDL